MDLTIVVMSQLEYFNAPMKGRRDWIMGKIDLFQNVI